jgi:hypothetical protein
MSKERLAVLLCGNRVGEMEKPLMTNHERLFQKSSKNQDVSRT